MRFIHSIRDLSHELENSNEIERAEILIQIKKECHDIWVGCLSCNEKSCVGIFKEDGYK